MARSALAQETVFALRETIARLEGKPIPALAAAQAQAVGDGQERAQDRPARLETGIAALDEALDGGLPLDAITEIRDKALSKGVNAFVSKPMQASDLQHALQACGL